MAKALSTNPPLAVDLQAVTYLHPGKRGVKGVDLQLPSGNVLALLGPNGSGKSTTLGLVAGFLEAQQGALTVFEQQVTPGLRARIGIVFQDSSLDELMTVHETLWLHGRLFGLGGDVLRGRIAELLDLTDLQDRSGDTVETLSGGLRRRLELARAVLHRPDLVLLDEPSLGLDPDSKARLWAMLLAINADGAAILVATNDVAEAEQYAQSVVFLEHGQIVAEGTPTELKRGLRRDSVRVEWPDAPQDLAGTLSKWSGVGQVTYAPPLVHATVDDASSFVPDLFGIAEGGIQGIRIRESTLEDAYFVLVGESLNGLNPPAEELQPSEKPQRSEETRP